MLAQGNSELLEFLKQIDNDLLGVVMIIATVGVFLSLIVFMVVVARTWNNLALTRMNQKMVQELLTKGYSVDEVERLTYGGQRWGGRVRRIVQSAKSGVTHVVNVARNRRYRNRPVPPLKHPV